MQKTIKNTVTFKDVGLHSGQSITMVIKPSSENTGITFIRTDLEEGKNIIPAKWNKVVDTRLCTVIANEHGASVATIEHLMSALRGLSLHNLIIEIDGPEVPAVDGSADPFVQKLQKAGVQEQKQPVKAIRILKEVRVEQEGKYAVLKPDEMSVFEGEIDFPHPVIGQQSYKTELVNGNFCHDIASARTFGFLKDLEAMRAQGLAQGGSLDNAIVLDQNAVVNKDGLRFKDEFIRHKLLDAIGDLYLAGGPIIGAYAGYKAGHAINNALLHALFADEQAWEIITLEEQQEGDAILAHMDSADSQGLPLQG